MTRVRRDYVDVRQATEFLQQARAARMQLRRKHFGARVAPGEQGGLAAGTCATIKNPAIDDRAIKGRTIKVRFSTADEQRDQLRSFILNGDAAFPVGARAGYVARKNAPRRREQSTRRELHACRGKLGIGLIVIRSTIVNVNGRRGHRLIMGAYLPRRL